MTGTDETSFHPPRHRGRATLGAALDLVRARPGRLVCALVVPVLPVVVLGSVLFTLLAPRLFALTRGPVVFTTAPSEVALSAPELVLLWVFAVAVPVSLGIGLSAALVVALGTCLDVRVSARAGVLRALRRPRSTALAALAVAVFLTALVILFVTALVILDALATETTSEVPFRVWLGAVVACPLCGASVLMVHRVARTLTASPLGRDLPPVPLTPGAVFRLVVVAGAVIGLTALVGGGAALLPGPSPLVWSAVLLVQGTVLVLGGALLAALLVVQTIWYHEGPPWAPRPGSPRAERLERQRSEVTALRGSLPSADSGRETAPVVATAAITVLIVPGTLWVGPGNPTAYSVAYTPVPGGELYSDSSTELVRVGDDLRVTAEGASLWCAPECVLLPTEMDWPEEEGDWHEEGSDLGTHTHLRGGSVRAWWRITEAGIDGPRELYVGTECDGTGCHGPEIVLETTEDFSSAPYSSPPAYLADVAEHEDGFHVVTAVFDVEREATRVETRSCAGDACAEPVTMGWVSTLGRLPTPAQALDSAVGPDGDLAVTLYDTSTGAVTLFRCSDTACTDADDTRVVPEATVAGGLHSVSGVDPVRFGARVEVRPDGLPVIAHRAARDGSARLLDCLDPVCERSEERVLSDPGWAQHLPGLALTPEGRPVLALADSRTDTVSLVSCSDAGCSDRETRVLHRARSVETGADLVVGPDGLPVVAAVVYAAGVRGGPVLALHRCGTPSCGLTG